MSPVSKIYENRMVRAALIAVMALLAAISVYQGAKNALSYSQDLQWDAAKALCMGLDPYELSQDPARANEYPELEAFYKMFTDRGLTQKMEANQFPSLLMLLFPVTLFSPQAAKAVWLVLNLLFAAGIIFLLRRTFLAGMSAFAFSFTVLFMLAGTPFRNQIGVGQHTLFAFFFFMLAVYAEKKDDGKKRALNSAAIAGCLFVSYFKYTLTAPLALYFVYKRRYRELVLSVAGHVVLTVFAALWLKKSVIYMLTAPLKVASALAAEGGIDLGVWLGGTYFAPVALLIAAALFVITVRMPEKKEYILFPMLVLWSLILAYHRTYDFFVLSAVPMLFCDGFSEDFGKKRTVFFSTWFAILITEVYFALRVFSESTASLVGTAVIYYGFTIAVTLFGIKLIKEDRKNG